MAIEKQTEQDGEEDTQRQFICSLCTSRKAQLIIIEQDEGNNVLLSLLCMDCGGFHTLRIPGSLPIQTTKPIEKKKEVSYLG